MLTNLSLTSVVVNYRQLKLLLMHSLLRKLLPWLS